MPDIPGLDGFQGKWYHTGQWPHDGVDFTGKRVGQIGTGSTGIQAVPVIAEQAAHLTVFQRTANYSVPAHNAPMKPEFKQWIKDNFAEIRKTHARDPERPLRSASASRSVFDVSDEERQRIYEEFWKRRAASSSAPAFSDLLLDKKANDTAARVHHQQDPQAS